ncbi:MAG TPA: hypothetical protein VGR62_03180 [Candidatus Binatia bacterium]|jgi:hypothetical protein|nr:hypothetical protein [Candidatus Binatia bacterium]
MIHPDYELVDAAGTPITLPEQAPSGLPLEPLDVPATGRRP